MSKEKSDKHESRPLGAAREATFPNFPPTISELRARALRAEAQYLMVEHYAGAIGDKKRRVNDDTKLIEFAQKTPGDQSDGSPDRANGNYADGNPAQTLNATADSIRTAKDLLRELAPVQQPATPSLSREEIIQMISQAVADVADATRPQEKSAIARLRELLEFQREMQAPAVPQHMEPEIRE